MSIALDRTITAKLSFALLLYKSTEVSVYGSFFVYLFTAFKLHHTVALPEY